MDQKVLTLVSGGIDSPIASIIAAEEFEIIPLNFCLVPMVPQESFLKTVDVLQNLREKIDYDESIIVPWAGMLKEIKTKIDQRYSCVACRRTMLKCAEKLCRQKEAKGIITGESLGQKASQTIENLSATSSKISVPVIRPLIGLNKDEIVKISREIEMLKEDHSGCCKATPSQPVTKAKEEKMNKKMRKINFEKILEKSLSLAISLEEFEDIGINYLDRLSAEFV